MNNKQFSNFNLICNSIIGLAIFIFVLTLLLLNTGCTYTVEPHEPIRSKELAIYDQSKNELITPHVIIPVDSALIHDLIARSFFHNDTVFNDFRIIMR